jgi:hypothetical protein
VGGQKTERRKWIHCFDSVTAILFVASLYSYDQYMEEDPEKNRMEDSVELFEKMFANEFLLRASIILFLNKSAWGGGGINNGNTTTPASGKTYSRISWCMLSCGNSFPSSRTRMNMSQHWPS